MLRGTGRGRAGPLRCAAAGPVLAGPGGALARTGQRRAGQVVDRGLAGPRHGNDRRGPYGAAEQRADEQRQAGHHGGHHGAAAQHPAPQIGDLDARAEPPPGLAGQPGVHGVDRGARDDQRAPGGEVDDVGRVVGGDGAPADGHQQRGGEQRAERRRRPAATGRRWSARRPRPGGTRRSGRRRQGARRRSHAAATASAQGSSDMQPLDHGAALAAVEVDGVAELAHAGVDGDQAEEDAQREQDDAEVHPAAGVVRVPDGVAAAPLGAGVVAPRASNRSS